MPTVEDRQKVFLHHTRSCAHSGLTASGVTALCLVKQEHSSGAQYPSTPPPPPPPALGFLGQKRLGGVGEG